MTGWEALVVWCLRGVNQYSREKPVPVPLCPPEILHKLNPQHNQGLRSDGLPTNHLRFGISYDILLNRHSKSGGIHQCNLFPNNKYNSSFFEIIHAEDCYSTERLEVTLLSAGCFIYCDLTCCNFRHVLKKISNAIY